MSRSSALRAIVVVGLLTSQVSAAGQIVSDVKLANGGRLHVQVVDAQGKAVAKAPVKVLFRGKAVVKAQTNEAGRFTIRGLRGGPHIVEVGGMPKACRLWTEAAAPPAASAQLLLVSDGRVLRAQGPGYTPAEGPVVYGGSLMNGPGSGLFSSNFLLGSTIVTSAAVLGGVIGFNYGLDRDDPPSSP